MIKNIRFHLTLLGIQTAQNQEGVNQAKTNGLTAISKVSPIGRDKANDELDKAKTRQDQTIDGNDNLSADEKRTAKEQVAEAVRNAKQAVQTAQNQEGVNQAKTNGLTAISKVSPIGRDKANDELDKAKTRQDQTIDGNDNLSADEKRTAKEQVAEAVRNAKQAVQTAQNQEGVNQAKTNGLTAISKVSPIGRDKANDELDKAKTRQDQTIDGNDNLSADEKRTAKEQVAEAVRNAKQAVQTAQNQEGVNQAKTNGLTAISKVSPIGRDKANDELDKAKTRQDQTIDGNDNLSADEKRTAKEQVAEAVRNAKQAVQTAQNQEGVNQAKTNGLNALDKILENLSDRINQRNSSTPGNGGNQAGSDSRGDTGNQGDRPAPSDDGNQGDANNQAQPTTPSAPAHSGDSMNQATGPSAQQRGAGNATAPESPQGLSESSVTPPARSRRSVAFAGGTQSSQEKQVNKSVLRDLIQDLETRLKDLDGIDQSVIDAAKVILGEGQEALRNADLTEAGLKEMTAKVKEALESLKGKQTTKDEETKETSKEQGHLPYGTMIGSLLALLGLLLFLIARRKKESELKKLTKELTKVLQESDLTNVDAKVLDQAREALAQAVAFLANEKESDHTEEELIEKLKAVLAQLR
ncbi:DUF1542 domain-containing protein [Streptococcus parapneumoniae]|uniref:DUF1542 domain-containing protein n=1 Tax=Streptococcus parapneumoniae TaxID=2993430 RepID=UPI0030D1CB45